jgi:hypothetical protein
MLHIRQIHTARVATSQIINGRCFKFDGLPEAEALFFPASEMSRLTRPRKSSNRCHSEQSKESLFDLRNKERFFALLRMTEQDIFSVGCEAATHKDHW